MNEWILLAMSMAVGSATGLFFFGGLWLTLRSITRFRRSTLAAVGSLIFRLSVALIILYLLSRGDPGSIGLWMLGFLITRTLLMRFSNDHVRAAEGS